MAWILNQIWLGPAKPPEQMEIAKNTALQLGMEYKRWNWTALTTMFGFFYFRNFRIERVSNRTYAFLVKCYLWYILDLYRTDVMFLDADKTLPFDSLRAPNFSQPGVYFGKGYDPWFVACNNRRAPKFAKERIEFHLRTREKANGVNMFLFLREVKYNIFGGRFTRSTLTPFFRNRQIKVFDTCDPTIDVPPVETPAKISLRPAPFERKPDAYMAITNVEQLDMQLSAISGKRKFAVPPIAALVPVGTKRIIIMGETVIGLTFLNMFVEEGDVLVHINSCQHLAGTQNLKGTAHAVYYDKQSLLPMEVRLNNERFLCCTRLFHETSFSPYKWYALTSSRIATPVALACSYKEQNPDVPVIIYGHNTADDLTHRYSTDMEESLLSINQIQLYLPHYDILFIVLTESTQISRCLTIETTWGKLLQYTSHALRFCYFDSANKEVPIDKAWPFLEPSSRAGKGKLMIRALKNAAHMHFKYVFVCHASTGVHPSHLWAHVLNAQVHISCNRRYDASRNLLCPSVASGVCIEDSIFRKLLPLLTDELADECNDSPDVILGRAIQDAHVPLEDVSTLFTGPDNRVIPSPANNVVSCPACTDAELKQIT